MKSLYTFLASGALYLATTAAAIAGPCAPTDPCDVPEPGSLALVGIAVAGLVWVARKRSK